MLWRIDGTAVHFAATIHVVDSADVPISAQLESRYREADHVVFECDLNDPGSESMGLLTDGSALEDHEPELAGEAYDVLADLGKDPDIFRHMKPWKVGLTLAIEHFLASGMSLNGIDRHYLVRAERNGKCVGYLERPIDGLNCFENGPEEEIHRMLRMAVQSPDAVVEEMTQMVEAWKTDDLTMLTRHAEDREQEYPGVYGCLLGGRNLRWLDKFVQLARDPRKCLVLVGALHCVGRRSIPKLLEESGISVSRVE